jgi:hypothetical protein
MPSVNINTSTISNPPGGVLTNPGTAFVVGATDQGPPASGPAYVRCLSIQDYVTAFGARSSTSATLYDWLDLLFHETPGAVAYVSRVTDSSATSALLQLSDAVPHPSVVVTAATPGVDGNNIFVAVSIASSAYTVTIQDAAGDILETWGPYLNSAGNAPLLAVTTSAYVKFTQSAGAGFTTASPATLAATALAGGANPSDLTDASYVSTLAGFPATLGPGTVAVPGRATATIWNGLLAHAAANNRFAALDLPESASTTTLIGDIGSIGTTPNASYGTFVEGSCTIPGVVPGTTRTVPASAAVAALRAQVGQTSSQNQAPSGADWPLSYVIGFTEFFGPAGAANLPAGSFAQSDVNTLSAAGINCFANYFGTLCLFGFVSPVPKTTDQTYWQATAACERMDLVVDAQQALGGLLFKPIDGAGKLTGRAQTALAAIITDHWSNDALYGDNASDAGSVVVAAPVNTPTTESQGQLNAQVTVRISPYVDTVNTGIVTIPITQQVP